MSRGFILYHVASQAAAASILQSGFVDGVGSFGIKTKLRGVFLSNRPLDANEVVRTSSNTVLAVTFASMQLSELDEYELDEVGKPYREWCISAGVVQRRATVLRAELDDGAVEEPSSHDAEIHKLRAVKFLY